MMDLQKNVRKTLWEILQKKFYTEHLSTFPCSVSSFNKNSALQELGWCTYYPKKVECRMLDTSYAQHSQLYLRSERGAGLPGAALN